MNTMSSSDEEASDMAEFLAQRAQEPEEKKRPQQFLRIIGKAGVGKSTHILENYGGDPGNYLITAYTGIAAARLGVKTISSRFRMGYESSHPVDLAIKIIYRAKEHFTIREMWGLVVDEFYTVPADVMIKLDKILQEIRRDDRPFGGLDLILVGDDRQTSCVDASAFVDTDLYKGLVFTETLLPHHDKMRLKPQYMAFCDKFRSPKLSTDKIFRLLEDPRFSKVEVPGKYVYHENRDVDARNLAEMEKFDGEVLGVFGRIPYKAHCPILILNNTKYCANGMIGELLSVTKGKKLEILFDTGIVEAPIAELKFAPAFSITIHRSQCNTFTGINIFLSRARIEKKRSESIRLIYTALTRVSRFGKCFVSVS
jgi:hypothetical protein